MCALSIAGAYHLDFRIPHWFNLHTGGRLGPNPFMLLLLGATLLGAVVAVAVPLIETTLILYNPANRTEIRLSQSRGLSRELSNDVRRPSAWTAVCEGRFEIVPPELRELQAQRSQHGLFLAAAVVLGVAWSVR